ncbi:MAG: hypothetical protein J6C93_07105 [Clostridia bacterium]|nr:hypothetical protein [Clostridia bacterium]
MNLLSVQGMGAVYLLFLFLLCVLLVFTVKLALFGYRTLYKNLPPERPKEEEKPPEPVYYIVERKKKRKQTEYTLPREIKFK